MNLIIFVLITFYYIQFAKTYPLINVFTFEVIKLLIIKIVIFLSVLLKTVYFWPESKKILKYQLEN